MCKTTLTPASPNTVSSTWNDDGVDQLTDNDSLTGVTEHFTWNEYESLTDSFPDGSFTTMGTFSTTDTGCDTLGRRRV